MKKFLVLLISLWLASSVQGQLNLDPYEPHTFACTSFISSENGMASDNYAHPWISKAFLFNTGLNINYPLTENIVWTLDGNVSFGTVNKDLKTILCTGTGINFRASENIYWQLKFVPRLFLFGNGVHTEGDNISIWVDVLTGPGFKYDLNYGHLFLECGITKDFTIVGVPGHYHNDVYLFLNIGYRYLIR